MYRNHVLSKSSNSTFISWMINSTLVEAEDEFVWRKFFDAYFYPGTLNHLLLTDKVTYE
jgi:hypothetical protein